MAVVLENVRLSYLLNVPRVVKLKRAVEPFDNYEPYECDLEQHIISRSRNGHNFDAGAYSIRLASKYSAKIRMLRDAQYFFVLENSSPLACLGFDLDDLDTLTVKQIQGRRNIGDTLDPFDWHESLLGISLEWGMINGFKQLRVLPAESNRWWDSVLIDDKDMPKHHRRLQRIYNTSSENLGLVFDPELYLYVAKLR